MRFGDGKTHINVYSKGATWLGRKLSNFAHTPFEHPEDGRFESVEGYWYWLGCKDERLRDAVGFEAKALGRELGAPDWIDTKEFRRKIKMALRAKIEQHGKIRAELACSSLPLKHYYRDTGGKPIPVTKADWILKELDDIRVDLAKQYQISRR